MAKTLNEKIAQAQLERQQAEARIKELLQQQKAEERKARNHRFCKRGGFMEKLLPDLAVLTDEQFETFFKNTTANNFGRKALAELLPPPPKPAAMPENAPNPAQDSGTAAAATAQPAANTETKPASKPTGTVQNGGANRNGSTATSSRVAG